MSTMNTLFPRRTGLAALLVVLAAALGACGPGVGGTGTGESAPVLDQFGATAASVCASELAALLSCPSGTGPSAPAPAQTVVHFADAADAPRTQLRLEGNLAELASPCTPLRFEGQWGLVAGQPGRYYGLVGLGAAAAPASLVVERIGAGVRLTVRDAGERVLLGPLLLAPVAGAAVPGGCS